MLHTHPLTCIYAHISAFLPLTMVEISGCLTKANTSISELDPSSSLTQVIQFWNCSIFLHHQIFPSYWIILISKHVIISPVLKQYSPSLYKPLPLPPQLIYSPFHSETYGFVSTSFSNSLLFLYTISPWLIYHTILSSLFLLPSWLDVKLFICEGLLVDSLLCFFDLFSLPMLILLSHNYYGFVQFCSLIGKGSPQCCCWSPSLSLFLILTPLLLLLYLILLFFPCFLILFSALCFF